MTYNTLMILYVSKKSVRKCEALLTCAVEAGVKISEAMISTVARVHLTKGFVKKSVRFWHARYVLILSLSLYTKNIKVKQVPAIRICRFEDVDHILFNCQDIEHASHQQILKNNIKNDFRIPSGLCLLSLKDILSAMSEAETRTTENLFRLAKLIHNFITHHHDNGVI